MYFLINLFLMTDSLKKALKIIIEVANPDKVILFGSRARGDFRPESDYDILVLKNYIKHTRKLAQRIRRNFDGIGAPVDLLVYQTNKYFQNINSPYMVYYSINKEGIIIYDKSR